LQQKQVSLTDKIPSMKKRFILLLVSICIAAVSNAQSVKKPTKDTGNAYRANDRVRTTGPKEGWPLEGKKADPDKKVKKQTDTVHRTKPKSS
jgi:hypothetical protein